jgi:hypothetical protein
MLIFLLLAASAAQPAAAAHARRHHRGYQVKGPIVLNALPDFSEFLAHGMTYVEQAMNNGRGTCNSGQIPDAARAELHVQGGCYERRWSARLVETLVDLAERRQDFSPPDYPGCVPDFYEALAAYPVEGKEVLVAGSISPWNEAVAVAFGAKSVTTSDYAEVVSESLLVNVLTVAQLAESGRTFDVVFSFSSIEHDGLGRCVARTESVHRRVFFLHT